jgi:hypothetical protein
MFDRALALRSQYFKKNNGLQHLLKGESTLKEVV